LRLLTILVALALPVTLRAANPAATDAHEAAAAAAFARARENPLLLQAFLRGMPKGGDLHMHLSGAIYAETFIADAAEDGLCVDRQSLTLLAAGPRQVCADGQTAAAYALGDQALYDRMVDAFSMRSFVPFAGFDGHDKFFASFDHFRLIDASHTGEWLAEVATRAAAQNESYLEIMITPGFRDATALAASIDWPALPADKVDFATLRGRLLAAGVREHVAAIRRDIRAFEARRDLEDHCGQPAATAAAATATATAAATATATAACGISMRYLFQVLRGLPPAVVYAQTLLGFETVAAEVAGGDPRYVGINFVMPEDGLISMRDYHLQMRMLDYLHSVYPQVRISLHAGELVQGLVPPEGLRFHIRQAIELGHAERIGHGVDVLYEDDPTSLLAQMARRHVMVEINLTSNDVILGVSGTRHPLPLYLSAGVPVALSTDDEGVSRIDLTHEYVRAVTDFGLGYADLKRSARVSLEHSFLPGASLWAAADEFTAPVSACGGQSPGALQPTAACSAYLRHSDRAAAQWELESRINRFESTFDDPRMP
jgi:adenosine deaminase